MATYGWRAGRALADGLFTESYRFDFYQAVKLLELMYPNRRPVGQDTDPKEEVVRFRSRVGFDHPPSDLDSMKGGDAGEPAEMTVNFMGLAGAVGPLPRWVTESVVRRAGQRDTAFQDFLDLFNHRLVSMMFQARRRTRVALHTRTPEESRYSRCLLALMGLGTSDLRDKMAVRDRSLLPYGGLLARSVRSLSGLKGILKDYFGVGVDAISYRGAWLKIENDQLTCLSSSGPNNCLGRTAVLGSRFWNQGAGYELRLGPLNMKQFLSFLPIGRAFPALRAITRFYAGDELDCHVRLTLKAEEVPELRLGPAADARLGWNTRITKVSPLYWESREDGGTQVVKTGVWKGVRRRVREDSRARVELYDLESDPQQRRDVSADHPDVVTQIVEIMKSPPRLTSINAVLRLGREGGARLGWTSWLKTRPLDDDDSQVALEMRTS